jgi:UDP-N-acetyl-2-amino-2-deoxyglucuronate dehydrogenase
MSSKKALKIGLIGCGRIAKVHADSIRQLEGLELAAVCDIVPERKEHFSEMYGAHGYDTCPDLLSKGAVDLVSIATPNGTHYEIARACFEKGFHVLMEKPVAITNAEAEELVVLARKKDLYFFAVKQVRYNPSIQVLKSACDEGRLGRLFSGSLVVRWTRPQEYFTESTWRGTKNMDGGALLNQGIHYVDILQWLLGDVHSVIGRTDRFFHDIEIEDTAMGLVLFESGAMGTIEFTINTYPHNMECSLTLLGEKGTVKLAGSAMNEIAIWEVKDTPEPVIPKGYPPYVYAGGLYQGSCPNHFFVYQDILNVFQGRNCSYVDGSEALRSLRIVNGLYASAAAGKEIVLGPV